MDLKTFILCAVLITSVLKLTTAHGLLGVWWTLLWVLIWSSKLFDDRFQNNICQFTPVFAVFGLQILILLDVSLIILDCVLVFTIKEVILYPVKLCSWCLETCSSPGSGSSVDTAPSSSVELSEQKTDESTIENQPLIIRQPVVTSSYNPGINDSPQEKKLTLIPEVEPY